MRAVLEPGARVPRVRALSHLLEQQPVRVEHGHLSDVVFLDAALLQLAEKFAHGVADGRRKYLPDIGRQDHALRADRLDHGDVLLVGQVIHREVDEGELAVGAVLPPHAGHGLRVELGRLE